MEMVRFSWDRSYRKRLQMEKMPKSQPEALIIMNPISGFNNAKSLRRLINDHFRRAGWSFSIYLTEKDVHPGPLIGEYLDKGVDLVVVAGGDGTIAAVAAGMAGSTIPMGIIPTGTWNAIARHLMLSFNPNKALALITGNHQVKHLDLMSMGTSIHAMNLGVGLSARVIKETSREKKRRFGNLAYYAGLVRQVFGIKLTSYRIIADGKKYRGKALEIMVANYGVVGLNAVESLLDVHPDDGKADVLIFKPRTVLDLPEMFWQALVRRKKRSPKFQQLRASSTIFIQTNPPMDVQADGEVVGQTPITVNVLQRSVRVIVP